MGQRNLVWLGACLIVAGCGSGERDTGSEQEVGVKRDALNGVAAVWTPQGPGPITSGQVENLASNPPGFPGTNPIGNQVTGAVHAVVVHPSDSNRLVAGAANGGLWTTDNGLTNPPTWTARGDQLPSMSIGALAQDPTNADSLVAGFGAVSNFNSISGPFAGLVRSADFGVTWTPVVPTSAITPNGRNIWSAVIRGNLIMVGDFNAFGVGLLRSADGGSTWTLPPTLASGRVLDIEADPTDANRYYTALGSALFRSDDAGLTWVNATGPTACVLPAAPDCNLLSQHFGAGVSHVRLAVGSGGRVYSALTRAGQPAYVGFSDDLGVSWTPMDVPRIPMSNAQNIADASGSPIVVTTVAPHGIAANDPFRNRVRISGVTGNLNANGDFVATVQSATTFTLTTCLTFPGCSNASSGAYTGGGSWFGTHTSNPNKNGQSAGKAGGQGGLNVALVVYPLDQNIIFLSGDRQESAISTGFPNFIGANDFTAQIWRGDASVPRSGTLPGTLPGPSGVVPSLQWEHVTHDQGVAAIPEGGTPLGSAPHADSRNMAFDSNNNLIEVDDGGIYRRTSPLDNTGDWSSIIGDLAVTELHDMAFDSVSNTLIGGAQDTGSPWQLGPGNTTWFDFFAADGGDSQVDTTSTPGQSLRYAFSQNFGGRRRCFVDATSTLVPGGCSTLALAVRCAGPAPCPDGMGGTFPVDVDPTTIANNFPFVTVIELNAFDAANPQRLVFLAGNSAYESLNAGDTIFQVRDAAGNATGGGAVAAVAGHPLDPEVLWVGGPMRVRTGATGSLDLTGTQPPGGAVRDIAIDPANAQVAYVVTSAGVSFTPDSGATWTPITGDLLAAGQLRSAGTLRTIQFVPGTPSKIYVGADGGVYVSSTASLGFWDRVGTGSLPNTLVMDSDYDAASDRLFVSTMGRGAWSLNAASSLNLPPAVQCQTSIPISADNQCLGHVQLGDVDNGSFDPEGGPITCTLSSTGPFGLGNFIVTLTCVDDQGASSHCDAQVTVQDNTPPTLSCPVSVNVPCTNASGAVATFAATAVDACGVGTPTCSPTSGSTFPLGSTIAGCTVADFSGNPAACTFDVTVALADSAACCPAGTNIITGTSNNDTLNGTNGSDCILGRGAQDVINGNGGNDFISGGEGDDVINGGTGVDLIFGGTGQDRLNGNAGNDVMSGGDGDDQCFGGDNDDKVLGGQGQDRLFGENGNDRVVGETGDDRLEGGAGDDTLVGGGLHDVCLGGPGTDTFLTCQSQTQ